MINNELKIKIGKNECRAFLQEGFYNDISSGCHLHKHNYTEIHIMCTKSGEALVDGKSYAISGTSMLVIPRGALHSCSVVEAGGRHRAFQIDLPVESFFSFDIDEGIANCFFEELERSKVSGDSGTVCAYLSLFCTRLPILDGVQASRIVDYGFLIFEFFSRNYGMNVRLCDLARVLWLSERQTERLVIEHTGKTFSEELSEIRMTMANELMEKTDMTMSDIAKYVGYSSYSGFWKAMKKYKCEEKRRK